MEEKNLENKKLTAKDIQLIFFRIYEFFKEKKELEIALLALVYSHLSDLLAQKYQKQILKIDTCFKSIKFAKRDEKIEYIGILKFDLEELKDKIIQNPKGISKNILMDSEISSLIREYPKLYYKYESLKNPEGELQQNINSIKTLLNEHSQSIKDIQSREVNVNKKKIAEMLKYISSKKIEFDKIVGSAAENKNALKYVNYASSCEKSARWLFWCSIFMMFAVAFLSIYLMWKIETLTEFKLLVRISLTFLILLPAFFMMREAKKLKDKEFQYNDIACRIITSGPYIDGLHIDEKEKDKLKADLVKDFFGRPIECRDDGGLPPIENICEIIKTCLDKKNN